MSSDIVSSIIKFNAQTNGRDKVCRLFQYGCRLAWGRLQYKDKKDLIQTVKNIESMLSMTRKLLRFGKSLDFLQGALKSIHLKDIVLRLTITLSKINQAFYLLFDHFLWFNTVGAVKLDRQYWGEVSARFYFATLILNFIRDLYGIWCVIKEELAVRKARMSSSSYKNGDANYQSLNRRPATMLEISQQNIPLILDTIKNLFDLPIPLCTLKYMQLSPTKQGIFGLVSSLVAVATVWNPNLKLVPS
ncbi:peroxisomal membrane protein 11B-like [Mercenaria mercenaria]|uniref:peroxisomal membrane protein 11B-like n=1 Tax=Mercenaria mercenaria TaxID=6596 RepID=UPI001E1D8183|nr:peroxisomal membrane protein 11B-like [Mercenaria mercenaria]